MSESSQPPPDPSAALEAIVESSRQANDHVLPRPQLFGDYDRLRERSWNSPARLLRMMLGGPWPEARQAGIVVLRKFMANSRTWKELAQKLFMRYDTLHQLRKDFPEEFQEAANKRGKNLKGRII